MLNINGLYATGFLLSLVTLGPMITCILLALIGFLKSFTKTIVGCMLLTASYAILGVLGLLLFKATMIFTLFLLLSNEQTKKKMNELNKKYNDDNLQKSLCNIEKITNNTQDNYYGFKKWITERVNENKILKKHIDSAKEYGVLIHDKLTKVFIVIKEDAYTVHKIMCDSNYDVYTTVTNCIYSGYMLLKFTYELVNTSTLINLPEMNMKIPQNEKEATEMINDINDTLNTINSLSSLMEGMTKVSGKSKHSKNKNVDDLFLKLLSKR